MAKVYLVTRGQYSDYRIVAVYSTEALADKAVEEINGNSSSYDQADVETFELDRYADEISRGYHHYFVRLNRHTGDVMECRRDSSIGWHDGEDVHRNLYFHVWAESDESAIKISNERRAMIVAGVIR